MKLSISRLVILSTFLFSINFAYAQQQAINHTNATPTVTAEVALKILVDGNQRFVEHRMLHPRDGIKRRIDVATHGQHPIAIVLSCSDSRVPPELIFDEGLGDLFVIRLAGNIADDAVIGSIEYAVKYLGVPLLMVLGHEGCGAISAAIDGDGKAEGHVSSLINAIRPAVDSVSKNQPMAKEDIPSPRFHELVVRENVKRVMTLLKENKPILADMIESEKLTMAGGFYHLASGKIDLVKN